MSSQFLGEVILFNKVAFIFNCFNMVKSSGMSSLLAVDTGSLWTVMSKIDSDDVSYSVYQRLNCIILRRGAMNGKAKVGCNVM